MIIGKNRLFRYIPDFIRYEKEQTEAYAEIPPTFFRSGFPPDRTQAFHNLSTGKKRKTSVTLFFYNTDK